jgi:hypothetical protein
MATAKPSPNFAVRPHDYSEISLCSSSNNPHDVLKPEQIHHVDNVDSVDTTDIKETKAWGLILAFALLFIPMLGISLIFLAFVVFSQLRVKFPVNQILPELPQPSRAPPGFFFTDITVGEFTLVGSWASNAAQFVLGPFMLLFSFLVAKEIIAKPASENSTKVLREVLSGTLVGNWRWVKYTLSPEKFKNSTLDKIRGHHSLRAVHVAAAGSITAGLLS